MSKNRNRRRPDPSVPSPFEQARDELFQHIMRCGVVGAALEHQEEWFNDTLGYLAEKFPELEDSQLAELRTLGSRFAQPPKPRTHATSAA